MQSCMVLTGTHTHTFFFKFDPELSFFILGGDLLLILSALDQWIRWISVMSAGRRISQKTQFRQAGLEDSKGNLYRVYM